MSAIPQRTIFTHLHPPKNSRLVGRKLLLACGVVFPLLWVGMDVVASFRYDGYSYVDQTISELSAIGAPTRTFWLVGGVVYGILEIAFAIGVWQVAGSKRALRVVAGLLVAHAVLNLVLGPFSAMHQRDVLAAGGATFSDTLHLVVVAIGALIFFAEIGFAATVFGKWFRYYSLATALAMVVFGFITSLYASDVRANEPTPWAGIYERINADGFMLWLVVFAVSLLMIQAKVAERAEGG